MRTICFYLIISYALLWLPACQKSTNQVTRINKEEFTIEEQQRVGDFLKTRIDADYERFPRLNAEVFADAHDYLNSLLETLLVSANIERRNELDWNVSIIRNDEARNAFILPGGHLYLYTGLLRYLNSEHELTSIIAHEIAYADSDDAINRLKAEYGGVFLGDILLGNDVGDLEGVITNLPHLVLTTNEVMEADIYSVNLLCDYAWDARGLKSIFERVDSVGVHLEWLETRQGDLQERISTIENAALSCGQEGQTFDERYNRFKTEWLP